MLVRLEWIYDFWPRKFIFAEILYFFIHLLWWYLQFKKSRWKIFPRTIFCPVLLQNGGFPDFYIPSFMYNKNRSFCMIPLSMTSLDFLWHLDSVILKSIQTLLRNFCWNKNCPGSGFFLNRHFHVHISRSIYLMLLFTILLKKLNKLSTTS